MKNRFNIVLNIAILLMLCVIFITNCHQKRKDAKCTSDTIMVIDTVHIESPVKIRRIPVSVPALVDTQAILKDYFAKNIYQDTLIRTEVLSVVIRDTVEKNGLSGREVYYTLRQPVLHEKHNGLSLSSMFAFKSIPVTLNYEREAWRFSAGYDVVNNVPVIGVGYRFARW